MATENIQLKFINRSEDLNNSSVVIFQKNAAENLDDFAVAWTVIENSKRFDNHPFRYSLDFSVSAQDSWGNFTPRMNAQPGQAYDMVLENSGDVLKLSNTSAANPEEVEIRNRLAQGAISGHVFRDGKLLAVKTNLTPEQKAAFQFHPQIFIGVVSDVQEGEVMNSAILSQVNTQISLFGISSADIVMTGGGADGGASTFQFQLENIKRDNS